jgi:hypothetical protein
MTFKGGALTIETKKPMPLSDAKTKTEIDELHYLYSKEIPLTEKLKEIQQQLMQIDFVALFSEKQEYDWNKRGYGSLEIAWREYHSVCLALSRIEHCQNREAIRLHELMKSLFAEISMEEWYVS